MKSNPYAGRITFSKLNFVDSKYNEVNRAISKNYKDNKKFPSYFEMENFIKQVLQKNQMELSETEIKSESKYIFIILLRQFKNHCIFLSCVTLLNFFNVKLLKGIIFSNLYPHILYQFSLHYVLLF